jgi:anti-sigma factor RsiW
MNINRHNYEEFFLLYVDNELTAGQRKIVEAFVATNPDLQEEFELIQQSTFTADVKLDQAFISSLLKPVGEESSISEEQLLLYLDSELKADEKAAVEKELNSSISLQKELQWLRRSQLTPDTSVVFPDKSLLYKQAEPARVFSMSVAARRWSAAAAVVVLLGSAMWLMLDGKKSTEQPGGQIASTDQRTEQTQKVQSTGPVSVENVVKATLDEQNEEFNKATAQTESNVKSDVPTKVTNASVAIVNPTDKTETPATPDVVEPIEIATTETPEKIIAGPGNIYTTPTVQPIETNKAANISYASYNNDVANDEEDNELFNEERQRKSGIAGLIKKAKRTFERKTGIQSSSSEVRFAVFAVNTQ